MGEEKVLLSIKDLKKHFPVGRQGLFKRGARLRANDGLSFDIYRGETFGLVGESGSGKSTLGRTILQLYKPTSGEVIYYQNERECIPAHGEMGEIGVDLSKLSPNEMRKYRKDLQIVFQDPYSSLNPKMTVGELIEEGIKVNVGGSRVERGRAVLQVMQDCGLPKDAIHRYPHQFSGGQRQRVAIARALAVKPKFIVCDECVSALDVSIQAQILNLLLDLKRKEGITYLFISHDLSVVRYLSDRIGVMYLGKMVELGKTKEALERPLHPYTIALLSAIPTFKKRKYPQIILNGQLPSPISPPQGCPFHPRCFMAEKICERIPVPMVEVDKGHFVACHFAQMPTEEKRRRAFLRAGEEESKE